MPAVWDGKELKQISVADFNARNQPSANSGSGSSSAQAISPMMGAPAQAQKTSGGGIKGGRDPIDPSKVEGNKFNTDEKYGYYNDQGKYVSAWQDRIDGGGRNQSGNYFSGGGLISSLLNAFKVRPAGAARARDDQGNYIVNRADIGYRDFNDMIDRGGPQASGGAFQGLGLYSDLANIFLGEKGERTPYAAQSAAAAQAVQDLQNPANWGVKPSSGGQSEPAGLLRPLARPSDEQRLMQMPVKPNTFYSQVAGEAGMGLSPFGDYGYQAIPQQPQITSSVLDQAAPQSVVYEIDNYLRRIGVPVTPQTRMEYMPAFRQQFGL